MKLAADPPPIRGARQESALAAVVSIQAIEVLTGLGLTLLGSMLPQLQGWWHLNDARSGILLLAVFSGASFGALLVRAPFRRSLIAGLLLMAIAMATLNLARGQLLFLPLLLFGLGLGLVMTSNSLILGERFLLRRAVMLTLLNFSWSAGAALCPFAAQWMLRHAGLAGTFWAIALASLMSVGIALRWIGPQQETPRTVRVASSQGSTTAIVTFFAIFAMLYCGAEASIGGWVLTYVQRMGFRIAAGPPLATSCFWLSVLVGRALAPAVLLRVREERMLVFSLTGAFAGVVTLLSARAMSLVLLASAVAGLCLAPVFPICVSILMTLSRDAAQARWLFALAGAGSASMPWITGLAAQRTGSLHVGLLVPLCALGIMLVMLRWPVAGMQFSRQLQPRDRHDPPEGVGSNPLPST